MLPEKGRHYQNREHLPKPIDEELLEGATARKIVRVEAGLDRGVGGNFIKRPQRYIGDKIYMMRIRNISEKASDLYLPQF